MCLHGTHGAPSPAGRPAVCTAQAAACMPPPASPRPAMYRHTAHLLCCALGAPSWRAAPKEAGPRGKAACAVWRAGGVLSQRRQARRGQSRRVALAALFDHLLTGGGGAASGLPACFCACFVITLRALPGPAIQDIAVHLLTTIFVTRHARNWLSALDFLKTNFLVA